MDPELRAELDERVRLGLSARNFREALYMRRRRKGTNFLADALVAAGSGPAAFVTSMGAGVAGVGRMMLPEDFEPDWLVSMQQELADQSSELSRVGFKANKPLAFISRLGAETAGVLGTVGAITSAGKIGRVSRLAGLARPVAPNIVGRTGMATTRLGNMVAGVPAAGVQAAGGPEASTAAALAHFLPEDSEARERIIEAMENPAIRIASEVGIDIALGGVMEIIGARIARSRARRKKGDSGVSDAEFVADPPKSPADLASEGKGRTERGIERRARGEVFEGAERRVEPERRISEVDEAARTISEQKSIDNLVAGGMERSDAEDLIRVGRDMPEGPVPATKAEMARAEIEARNTRVEDMPLEGITGPRAGARKVVRGVPKPEGHQVQYTKVSDDIEAQMAFEDTYDELLATGMVPEAVTKTHDALRAAARDMGVDDLAGAAKRTNLDSVELMALRGNFVSNRDKIFNASARMSQILDEVDSRSIGTKRAEQLLDEADEIERSMLLMEKQNESYVAAFVRGASEAGRTLNSLRAMSTASADPFYWMLKMRKIKAIASGHNIGRAGDTALLRNRNPMPDLTQQEKLLFNEALEKMQSGDNRAMSDLATSLSGEAGILDKIIQVRRAGLLTGVKTMGRNILSNTVEAILEEGPERAMATVLDRFVAPFVSGVRKVPRTVTRRGAEGVEVDVGVGTEFRSTIFTPVARAKAASKGAWEGAKKAKRVLINGEDFSQGMEAGIEGDVIARKWDEIQSGRLDRDSMVGRTVSWIFDLQGGYDAVYRFAAFWGAIDEQAQLFTRHLPENRRAAAKQALVDDPHPEMIDEAVRQSVDRVFANRTKIAEMMSALDRTFSSWRLDSRIDHRVAGHLARFAFGWVAPFRRTPSSLLTRFFIERGPLGPVNTVLKAKNLRVAGNRIQVLLAENGNITMRDLAELRQLQKEFVTAGSRAATGAGVMAMGAWLASKGLATGAMPASNAERQKWQQHGKVPYAVRIGDNWHSLTGMAPFGNLLGYGAQTFQDVSEQGATAGSMAAAQGAGRMFLEQSFMRGINEINKAIMSGGTYSDRFVSSQTGSLIPTIMSDLAILSDGYLRETVGDNLAETAAFGMMRRIPGVSRMVPAKLDVFGERIPLGASAALSPTVPREIPQTGVKASLAEADLRVPVAASGRGQTREEHREETRTQGPEIEGAVVQLFRSAGFRRLDNEQQQAVIGNLSSRIRRYMNANDGRTKSWASDVRAALQSVR